jgi:hypothetical protein
MARRVITSISVMGTPNTHIGMPRNNGAYMSAEVPVDSDNITIFSGSTLPFTGYSSAHPVSYYEDMFYRIYNPLETKDGIFDINAYIEWTDDFTPTGEDLDGDEDVMTGLTWSATWLVGAEDVVQTDLTGAINIFPLKDKTLDTVGATITRMRLDFSTGCTFTGAVTMVCEFWANANSVASASNPYNDGTNINIRKNTRRTNVNTDRFS